MLLLIRNRKNYPKAPKNDPRRRRGGGSWRGAGRLRVEGLKTHKKTGIWGAPGGSLLATIFHERSEREPEWRHVRSKV